MRERLRTFRRRHEGSLLFAAGLLIAAVAALYYQAGQPPAREFVQEDIDAAVLHTLENKTLPSRAAKAAELVRQSFVRVNGFDDNKLYQISDNVSYTTCPAHARCRSACSRQRALRR